MDPTAPVFTPPSPCPRGALIAIEGLDHAGKSTQCSLLAQKLAAAGHPAVVYKFPDRTTATGAIIDSYLTGSVKVQAQSIHLLFSSNRWEAISSLLVTLEKGTTVILDRYIHSGIAFSTAKGLDYAWCRAPEVGLPKPDKVVFLDLDAESVAQREGFGEEVYEKKELQSKVRGIFLSMRDQDSEDDWVVIDAGRDVGIVAEDVWLKTEPVVRWASKNKLREFTA